MVVEDDDSGLGTEGGASTGTGTEGRAGCEVSKAEPGSCGGRSVLTLRVGGRVGDGTVGFVVPARRAEEK